MEVNRQLRKTVRRWGLRLRLSESLSWGLWGAVVGLSLGLLLALAARLWPLLLARQLVGPAGLLTLAGATFGIAFAWLRPRSLASFARTFDRRFDLAERLTTAVEIGGGRLRATPEMSAAQLADTLDVTARANPRAMLPLRPSRWALLASGVLIVALALSLWLPNPQEGILLQRAAVRAAIEEQIKALETIQEGVAEAEELTETEREMLLQALDEAIAALDAGQATPEEAVAALSEAEQTLAELQDPGAATTQAGLESAAEEMADSELTRAIAEALANGDYETAMEALAAYGSEEGEPLTRDEALELARELAQAAEALAESDPALAEQLARAAQAIEQGNVEEAQEAIREAARRMGEAGERVERQEAIEGVLAQLQKGREQVAQACGAEPSPGQGSAEGQSPGNGQQTQPGHHEDAGSGTPYDEVYVPNRFDEEGQGVDVEREGDDGIPVGDAPLPAPEGGRAGVPYQTVYADYADQASAALEGSYIPLGMKQYVRKYFSSLEP
jgi:hypothetical protein